MTVRFADIVDWDSLRNTVVYGLIAGVGITAAYGFALLGVDRAQEKYQAGRPFQAALYGVVGLIGVAGTLGGIVLGLIAVSDK